MKKSLNVGFVAVFAAFHATLYFLSPPILWRNWAIYLEPIEGIVLGPWAGFSAAFIGSILGRMIKPDVFWMFGIIAEPLSVLMVAFLVKRQWLPVLITYSVMLAAYFSHPFGARLPLWTILDILLAFALIYPVAKLSRIGVQGNVSRLTVSLVLVSFIGTVTDALTRVFLFVPAGLYAFLGLSFDALFVIFTTGASASYIEDLIVVVMSFLVGVPLLLAIQKIPGFKYPIT